MGSSQTNKHEKLIVDSIHGGIYLTEREVQVIDTASFQRLRHLKQLAMAQLVYPTATHTRFAHSIGTLGMMERILRAAKNNGIKFKKEERENLRIAALLHDIGHYPYSHLMEKIDKSKLTEELVAGGQPDGKPLNASKTKYPEHTEVGKLIVTNQDDLIKAIGGEDRAKTIAELFTLHPRLSKLIHSSLDIDRLDYLPRDSHATGVPYGQIDVNYLLNNLKVNQEGAIGFLERALPAVEHLLLARFFMHRVVYYHKTIYGFEEVCRQLLRRLRDRDGEHYSIPVDGKAVEDKVVSPDLNNFTDAFVDNVIQQAVEDEDKVVQALARCVQSRKPPKLLKEVQICEETEEEYHAGSTFKQNCKAKLSKLADEFKIPLGQFLFCETSSFVGKNPKKYTASEAVKLPSDDIRSRASEEEEEDIKIFVGNDAEPISWRGIKHSLVAKYANYSLQVFRLYVVYDDDVVISKLGDKVKDWDKTE